MSPVLRWRQGEAFPTAHLAVKGPCPQRVPLFPQQSEAKCFAPDHQSLLPKSLQRGLAIKPCSLCHPLQLHHPTRPVSLPPSTQAQAGLSSSPPPPDLSALKSQLLPETSLTITAPLDLAAGMQTALHTRDAQKITPIRNLSTYYVQGSVICTGDMAVSKYTLLSCSLQLAFSYPLTRCCSTVVLLDWHSLFL